VAALGSACTVIDEHGAAIDRIEVETAPEGIADKLMQHNPMVHPSVTMRSTALHELGGYRELAGRTAQDYDLWLRMAERWQLANLSASLLHYRMHGDQITIDKSVQQKRAAEFYRELARQRRSGVSENVAAAHEHVSKLAKQISSECAADVLHRAALLAQRGDAAQARSLRWRAIRQAPTSPAVRQFLRGRLAWYLRRAVGAR
jgi:hypothetical protein